MNGSESASDRETQIKNDEIKEIVRSNCSAPENLLEGCKKDFQSAIKDYSIALERRAELMAMTNSTSSTLFTEQPTKESEGNAGIQRNRRV